MRVLTGAVLEACRGKLHDDATVMVMDWYGTRGEDTLGRERIPSRGETGQASQSA